MPETTNESLRTAFRDRRRAAFAGALSEVGGRIEDNIAISLNVPFPPASRPGEKPHRRTGALRAGVRHDGGIEGNEFVEYISVQRAGPPGVAFKLEMQMDRQFMEPARDQWSQILPQMFPPLVIERLR